MVNTLYADTQELRAYLGIKDELDEDNLTLAVDTASRWIDEECRRRFYLDDLATGVANPALARTYYGCGEDLEVDDFDPATPITVTGSADGTFSTTYTLNTGYFPLPLNAATIGRPYNRLRRINNCWPIATRGLATVRVVARWGWPAVPGPIKQACLIAASDMFKMKDAPFGVAAFGDLGALRVRANSAVDQLLAPYKLGPLVG